MPLLREALAPLVATARDVAQSVTARHADADDRDARWPAETMRALADAGLLGLTAPRDVGGLDAGMQGLVAVSETLAHESASAGLCFGMHCVGTAVIAAKANDAQRECQDTVGELARSSRRRWVSLPRGAACRCSRA